MASNERPDSTDHTTEAYVDSSRSNTSSTKKTDESIDRSRLNTTKKTKIQRINIFANNDFISDTTEVCG